jgi:hypothetical protein
VTTLVPDDRDLAAALKKFVADECFFGDRGQRVLVISETANGYEVSARLNPAEIRKSTHLSRVREIQASGTGAKAIIHINMRGWSATQAFVCLLASDYELYRLRPQKPPKGWRWVQVTDRMRERWDEVWGRL